MSELVKMCKEGAVAIVTLNRPEAMNALSSAMRKALFDALSSLESDDEVRAIVLTGEGERAFTAGLDLKELGADPDALEVALSDNGEHNPVKAIEMCGKPVVGAINGVAITGGLEVALACDVLIASTQARFADTHARVGILPGWGLSQKLSRLIGISRAKEMSFTGNFLDAATAERWGLINHVVPPADLLPMAIGLAKDMASIEPSTLRNYKQLIDKGYAASFGDALGIELRTSKEANAGVEPAQVEARRREVQSRGRAQ